MGLTLATLEQELKTGTVQPIYVVQGTDQYLLDQVRNAFKALIPVADHTMNLAQFDMHETNLAVALDDARSMPFFGERRVVIINQAYFLTGEQPRNKQEHQVDELIDYIQNPEPQTVLVLMAPYEKLDNRKKVTKLAKERTGFLQFGELKQADVSQLVQRRLKAAGYQMSAEALQRLIRLTNMDVTQMMTELDKLMLYAYQTKVIETDAVDALVTRTLAENVFDLIEALVQQKIQVAIHLYHDLLRSGEEPLRLHGALMSQFRLLLQVKASKLSESGLATQLKVHPYRVKLAKQIVRRYRYDGLAYAYLGLVQMEEQLKSSPQDPALLFELFVLTYQNKTKA